MFWRKACLACIGGLWGDPPTQCPDQYSTMSLSHLLSCLVYCSVLLTTLSVMSYTHHLPILTSNTKYNKFSNFLVDQKKKKLGERLWDDLVVDMSPIVLFRLSKSQTNSYSAAKERHVGSHV